MPILSRISHGNFQKLAGGVRAIILLTVLMGGPFVAEAGRSAVETGLAGPHAASVEPEARKQFLEQLGHLPLRFVENRGEMDPRVKFYFQGLRESIFFTREGVTFSLAGKPVPAPTVNSPMPGLPGGLEKSRAATVRLEPVGLRPEAEIVPEDRAPDRVHSYQGSDPGRWRTNLPVYRAVRYREAYPGVDLKFYGADGRLEYDVIVKPGADPGQVKLACEGVENLAVNAEGDLVARLADGGELVHRKPFVYQEIDGQRLVREGRFQILDREPRPAFGFQVAAYDPGHPLVIDPVLAYSTYLGGTFWDMPFGIAVDGKGYAYVTGWKNSADFPVEGRIHVTSDESVFLVKLTPAGELYYTVFLGGNNDDYGTAVAVDKTGNGFITGFTQSHNFPRLYPPNSGIYKWGPSNPDFSNGFVAKFDMDGYLVYSIYLGGGEWDYPTSLAVAADGGVYVGGYTESPKFPYEWLPFSENGLHPYRGGGDGFVAYIPPDVNAQPTSTFLGGTGQDSVTGLVLNAAGAIHVTGNTTSPDFPLNAAADGSYGGNGDAFVAKIAPGFKALAYSTYLGGSAGDEARGIAYRDGHVYVGGWTASEDFPVKNPLYPYAGKGDAFVSRFSAKGGLVYSTCLGGSVTEGARGIALDAQGSIYVAGSTCSGDFPLKKPLATSTVRGLDDRIIIEDTYRAFVSKINPKGNGLVYSTKLGGTDGAETGNAIAVDSKGNAYVTGMTSSHDFPVKNAALPYNLGYSPGFVTKLRSK
jgi:hypothetical protein